MRESIDSGRANASTPNFDSKTAFGCTRNLDTDQIIVYSTEKPAMWVRRYEPHAATGIEPCSTLRSYDMPLWKLATKASTLLLARIVQPLEGSWYHHLVPSRPHNRSATVQGDTPGPYLRDALRLPPGLARAQRTRRAADEMHTTVAQMIAKIICRNAQFAQSDVSGVRAFDRTCACTNSLACRTPTAPLSATVVADFLRIGV